MATEMVTERDVRDAIARVANLQGVLMCVYKVLDEQGIGSPTWECAEAVQGAIHMARESFCVLNDNSVSFAVKEA